MNRRNVDTPEAPAQYQTFTAGVLKINEWWAELPRTPADQAFLVRLLCLLASIMLVLTAVIVLDAVRCWWTILRLRPSVRRSIPRSTLSA